MKHQNVQGQKMKSFSFMRKLGEGAWAIVYQAFDQNTNSTVAVKAIPRKLMVDTPKLKELVATEIRVLKECHSQNVIRYVDAWCTQRTQFIAMEYCNGGDLEGYLDKKKRLTQDQATNFLKQILNGFRGLHQVNAMHRDFKVANVLLHEGVCKIADLGFAKQLDKKKVTATILGTSLTMAPQLLRDQKYGMEADIWSVGVVYYQLLYGHYPFMGNSDNQILQKIQKTRPDFKRVNISDNARDFIMRCLTDNPTKRISWREIYNHPLIREEAKMIYGLTSKMNFKKGEQFYKGNVEVEVDLLNTAHRKMIEFEQIQEARKADVQKMQKEAEEKRKMSSAIQQYEKMYLNKRNNIMFIFKFITPYIFNIMGQVRANHEITLFILCKKAYHQIKAFHHYVKSKANFLKLAPYFNQFTKSNKYQALIDTLASDTDIILAQMACYKEQIQSCSTQIKKQFQFDVINSKNWDGLVNQITNTYEFQLSEGLDNLKGHQKIDLLKIIQAVIYYRENKDADIESFQREVECMDFEFEEVKIRSKLKSTYS